jgi:hypothetical protein
LSVAKSGAAVRNSPSSPDFATLKPGYGRIIRKLCDQCA